MKIISLAEFRKRAKSVLRAVAKGQRFVLTYRGKPAAHLVQAGHTSVSASDPIYSLADLANSALGSVTTSEIDRVIYDPPS
jgi:prevent-host-death family protein